MINQFQHSNQFGITYKLESRQSGMDRITGVTLNTATEVIDLLEVMVGGMDIKNRIWVNNNPENTTSYYFVKSNSIQIASKIGMDSPLFLTTLIHELCHAQQSQDEFWRKLLFDYNDVLNGDYMLTQNRLSQIADHLPEVGEVFSLNSKFTSYFDTYRLASNELNNLYYPALPVRTLWKTITRSYAQELLQYEEDKLAVDERKEELSRILRESKATYNQKMCNRLPALLVEFDANQRMYNCLDSLKNQGFVLPEICLDQVTGQVRVIENKMQQAVGLWVEGEFSYPENYAEVAQLCN